MRQLRKYFSFFVASLYGSTVMQCIPPYKPDYEIGYGRLIFKDLCQNEKVYLFNFDILNSNRVKNSFYDTLTINGVTYNRVVRLDTSQSSFLDQKKINDKLAIDFNPSGRGSLPTCANLPARSLDKIQVLSISNVQY